MAETPKLRRVDRLPLRRDDEALIVLVDPMGLCEPLAVDAEMGPLLDLLADGGRTADQVRQSLSMRGVLDLDRDSLIEFVDELGRGGWLDDDHYRERLEATIVEFESSAERDANLAGLLYPGHEGTLRELLAGVGIRTKAGSRTCAVVTPHQPIERMEGALASALGSLPPADELDLVIVLGTDHGPGLFPYAVTDKPYSTPLGRVPNAPELVGLLERRVDGCKREEIRHRRADSLEWASLLCAAAWGGDAPPCLPIVCGRNALDESPDVEAMLGALELLMEGRRTLLWCSAELNHVGAAYGSDDAASALAREGDEGLFDLLGARHAERFRQRCVDAGSSQGPSGAAALFTLLRLLPLNARVSSSRYLPLPAPHAAEDGPLGHCGVVGMCFETP